LNRHAPILRWAGWCHAIADGKQLLVLLPDWNPSLPRQTTTEVSSGSTSSDDAVPQSLFDDSPPQSSWRETPEASPPISTLRSRRTQKILILQTPIPSRRARSRQTQTLLIRPALVTLRLLHRTRGGADRYLRLRVRWRQDAILLRARGRQTTIHRKARRRTVRRQQGLNRQQTVFLQRVRSYRVPRSSSPRLFSAS
jgi:hypothetical protein